MKGYKITSSFKYYASHFSGKTGYNRLYALMNRFRRLFIVNLLVPEPSNHQVPAFTIKNRKLIYLPFFENLRWNALMPANPKPNKGNAAGKGTSEGCSNLRLAIG